MKFRPYLFGMLAVMLLGGTAAAAEPPITHKGSGLPLPRFASL